MSYASRADVVARYGREKYDLVGDTNDDGAADDDAVDQALDDATDLVKSYLPDSIPDSAAPPYIRRITVDVAVYFLADTADVLTDEVRRRYEDALDWLKDVASGRADVDATATGQAGTTAFKASPRVFTRDALRTL